jgi:hypothetical protein
MIDLYRDDQPDPHDIGRFERQTILACMGASEDEITGRSCTLDLSSHAAPGKCEDRRGPVLSSAAERRPRWSRD